jgi:hypothetical protein
MQRLIFMASLLITFASLAAQSQSSPTSSGGIQKDPKAILMLTQSLDALGGAFQWSQFSCATIDGTVTYSKAGEPSPIRIKHCWNNLSLQSRHEFVYGSSKVIRYADPAKGTSISTDGIVQDLSDKARVEDLPEKLPAVAFMIALGKTEYSITFITPTRTEPHIGVRLLHVEKGVPVPASEQDWYFSDTTLLPDHVETYLQDSVNKSRLFRSKTGFSGFVNDGSVKVPSGIEQTLISGSTRAMTFQSINLKSSSLAGDFDPSVAGSQQ